MMPTAFFVNYRLRHDQISATANYWRDLIISRWGETKCVFMFSDEIYWKRTK